MSLVSFLSLYLVSFFTLLAPCTKAELGGRKMERPFSGKLLLVGEGDFSLSVSLSCLYPCVTLPDITASCLESDVSILKHKGAASNIASLQQREVTVKFRVDATMLHENPEINRIHFERIIFNFPHVGGKSNIKKNRKLLNDFFISAAQVLKEKGQIMVTLCKGQGGTLADQPMRAWHDSWQVVSMAANAGLILTETVPFVAQKFQVYSSTGFRSQDKWFHTEGAITHIFEKAERVTEPCDQETHYLDNKFHRNLHLQDGNPVSQVKNVLEKILCGHQETKVLGPMLFQSELADEALLDLENLLHGDEVAKQCTGDSVTADSSCLPLTTWLYKLDTRCNTKSKVSLVKTDWLHKKKSRVTESLFPKFKIDQSVSGPASQQTGNEDHGTLGPCCHSDQHLCTSLLEYVPEIVKLSGSKPLLYSGEVYKPCLIKDDNVPVNYEMICLFPLSCDRNCGDDHHLAHNFQTERVEACEVMSTLCQVIKAELIPNLVVSEFSQKKEFDTQNCMSPLATVEVTEGNTTISVAKVWTLNSKYSLQTYLIIVFDLTLLTLYLYNIPQKQLLWSTDCRVVQQFRKTNFDWPVYKPISLYPVEFSHDMSFWENKDALFDEMVYHEIIRNVGGDIITSVELMETYVDSDTRRTSRCYRLLFKSYDKALCYNASWHVQSAIRLQVAKQMEVGLR